MTLCWSRARKTAILKALLRSLIVLDIFASFNSLTLLLCEDCESPDYVHLVGEVLSIIILLFSNILAIRGIQNNQPNIIVPWLVVYMIGVLACYAGSALLLSESVFNGAWNFDWFLPLAGGVIFNTIWVLANSVYSAMKLEIISHHDEVIESDLEKSRYF